MAIKTAEDTIRLGDSFNHACRIQKNYGVLEQNTNMVKRVVDSRMAMATGQREF